MAKTELSIDSHIVDIQKILKRDQMLILQSDPGSGKTTRLPPSLVDSVKGTILVLEPRRVAAATAATRVCEECDWNVGEETGYQVRFDNKTSKNTKLIYVTEAILLKYFLENPTLEGIGCVILDEFHERSVHTDIALALLKELKLLSRPDLILIVMSATLNTESLEKYLSCKSYIVRAPQHKLTIEYSQKPQKLKTDIDFIQAVGTEVLKRAQSGHGLVFLPGLSEIRRLESWLKERTKTEIFILHGRLSLNEQKAVLAPSKSQKIILATNIAESALTIDGVNWVIDSGLEREARYSQKTDGTSLRTVRISKSSATQRAGRAARQGPGYVFRMWTKLDELSMRDYTEPEVFKTDLSVYILKLIQLGYRDPFSLDWFETPTRQHIEHCLTTLNNLGLLDAQKSLTPLGGRIAKSSLGLRQSLLLESQNKKLAACLIASMEESQVTPTPEECDLWEQINNPNAKLKQTASQILKEPLLTTDFVRTDLYEVLSLGFLDRLCKRRNPGSAEALMMNGRGVILSKESQVKTSDWFFAIELMDGVQEQTLVTKASGVNTDWIVKRISTQLVQKKSIHFNKNTRRFECVKSQNYGAISINTPQAARAESEEIQDLFVEWLIENFDWAIEQNQKFTSWWARFRFYQKHKEIVIDTAQKREIAVELTYSCSSLDEVLKKDWVYTFQRVLEVPELDTSCPKTLLLSNGEKIQIEYSELRPPFAQLPLQLAFGCAEAPKILNTQITLELLAPNKRPLQLTSDLASFWKNSYNEVKKEMRARYPKHHWPDNPLEAQAVRLKKHLNKNSK